MLYFENDYCEGAHSAILQRLLETNMEKLPGYGTDPYCASAREKIRHATGCPDADVYFLVGGTQTNVTVIRSMLKPYEGVLAASCGHISVHEAGAVEASGHKVLELPHREGRLSAGCLREYLEAFYKDESHEHMVFPGMVYLSHPTEYGTLYSRKELAEISELCKTYRLPLFLDGARLCYGLAVESSDVTLNDLARLTTVFYIGGTKAGALCGEAVVFPERAPAHFMTMVKQQGALLAKGRLTGIQFDTLFTGGLYLKISRHAIRAADRLREALRERGCRFYVDAPANQIFIILKNEIMEQLRKEVVFSIWAPYDSGHTIVRFVTSWGTRMEDIEQLICLLPDQLA